MNGSKVVSGSHRLDRCQVKGATAWWSARQRQQRELYLVHGSPPKVTGGMQRLSRGERTIDMYEKENR